MKVLRSLAPHTNDAWQPTQQHKLFHTSKLVCVKKPRSPAVTLIRSATSLVRVSSASFSAGSMADEALAPIYSALLLMKRVNLL